VEEISDFLGVIPEVGTHGRGGHKAFQKRNLGGVVIFQDAEDPENFFGFEMADVTAHVAG
jgi:hypothetical protein